METAGTALRNLVTTPYNLLKINLMKKFIYTSLLSLLAVSATAQVSIGGKDNVEGNSTLLDFNSPFLSGSTIQTENDNTKGIILPAVDNLNSALATTVGVNNGTFLFDKSDNKVKMFEKNAWVSLSDVGNASLISANSTNDTDAQQGVIIGSDTSSAKGVLVLESADKAMILPRIMNPHLTVKSPYPGMMCYDTVSKSLAVFNGSVWNYWK